MTRPVRILRNIAIGLVALIVIVLITATQVVQTDWFRNYVRDKIVAATQDALGGRVELRSFSFDWRHLRAEVNDFVIHGKEPPNAAPFLRVARVQVDLSLFTGFKRILNVDALRVEQPQANIITLRDGTLNIPQPEKKSTSDTSPLETVVDLAVGRFDLINGLLRYNDAARPVDVRGENLRAQLTFNALTRAYQGNLSLQPLYVVQGHANPVVFTLAVPVTIQRDQVTVKDATISTPASRLKLNGTLTSLQAEGYLGVTDVNSLAGASLAIIPGRSEIEIDAAVQLENETLKVDKLHVALGKSRIDASGRGNSLDFTSNLVLEELVATARVPQKLSGEVSIEGSTRFDSKLIEVENLRVRGFGGELTGNAKLENLARFEAHGRLQGFDLQSLQQRAGLKPLPYSGALSGSFDAQGNVKEPGAAIDAQTNLQIAPGRRGIPLSGRIEASYRAADGTIRARDSYLALPHSRLTFAGSFQNELKLDLTSRDLGDLLAAVPGTPPPVRLNGGALNVSATVTGSMKSPRVAGRASATSIAIQDRQFDSIATGFSALPSRFTLQDGTLRRGAMQGSFAGSVGLVNWSPKPDRPVALTASLANGDLADALALAGQKSEGYSGALTVQANINGTVGNPTGAADVTVAKGALQNEPFDNLQLRVVLADQLVRVPSAFLARGRERVDLTAEFRHPRDSFNTGHVEARVVSNQVELGNVRNLQSRRPGIAGVFQVDAAVAGDLAPQQEFRLTGVTADLSAKRLRVDGEDFGDVTGKASTAGDTVSYNLTSNFTGAQIRATGRTQLAPEYPSNVEANWSGLSVERALATARRSDIPARGTSSGTVHFSGTMKDPQGNAQLELRNAVLYDEPIDSLRLNAVAQPTSIEITRFEATAGDSQIALTGRFDHPRAAFDQGSLAFNLKSGTLDLRRLRNVQQRRPGLGGTLEISADGKGALRASGPNRVDLQGLTARIAATGLRASGRDLGNVEITANGNGGKLNFALDSNLASAAIRGRGTAAISGDYPVNAELTFDNVSWLNVQPLLSSTPSQAMDAVTSGRVTVNGPVANLDQLTGSLRLGKLQVRAIQPNLTLQNDGDIAVSMQKGLIRVDSAHIIGRNTDINLSGSGSSRGEKLDFRLNAHSDLALLRALSTDIYSSGQITMTAAVQGSVNKPSVNGKLELRDAAVASGDLPVGLSKANGAIVFNGSTASIQSLSGEAGGGKITVTGSVTRADNLRFALKVNAAGVRARIQQGVSAVATANINIAGTQDASLVSGLVTIDKLTYLPQTDIGSMLTRSAPPVQSSADTSPILQNMMLDIRVRTSATTSVQASLAQNLQMSTDLHVRGRVSQPGVTGSIQMSHGELAFFGSTYRLSSGTISFYNPNRIDPILNITLETQAKGVTVVLSVTGPVDNMKLSYTSDPPLQFEEIVALLASGKPPTSDPTLLANQPTQPAQTFQQRGETALVSKALADPISNRLQRVFGVSQLKIDPTFTSGSQLPQARVTLQQQVASNLLFTYVTALDNPNTQIVRIEWSMNPQWSAAINRDENGIVSLNLLYKKQFR